MGLLRQLSRLLKSWLFGAICDRVSFLARSMQTMVGILGKPKVLVRDLFLYMVWPLLVYSNPWELNGGRYCESYSNRTGVLVRKQRHRAKGSGVGPDDSAGNDVSSAAKTEANETRKSSLKLLGGLP